MGEHYTVRLLLEWVANVGCSNWNGEYRLRIAAINGDYEKVRVLLQWRADFKARNVFIDICTGES